MNDRDDTKKDSLILSGNRSLAIERLELVKRGLELIQKLKKRQIEVMIGNLPSSVITEVVSEYVKLATENEYDLKIRSIFYAEELLELAQNGAVDIFILILNNIWFPDYPFQERWQLITQINKICGSPVITLLFLSAGLEHPSLATRAKESSDFFFSMPFKGNDFMVAIKKCLHMLPIFDDVSRKRLKGNAGHNIT